MKGRVIKSTGSWYLVHTEQGILSARLKGKFKQDELKLTNPIAVGDWVILEKEVGQESAVIEEILQRDNYVIRKSTLSTIQVYHYIKVLINQLSV